MLFWKSQIYSLATWQFEIVIQENVTFYAAQSETHSHESKRHYGYRAMTSNSPISRQTFMKVNRNIGPGHNVLT